MGGKVKRRLKGSPTWVRNASERRNLDPLTAAVKKRVKARSLFKDAGALTGRPDPNGICDMCHVATRNGRVVVYFRFSKLCNEILHVDSSTNIMLEFADEHKFNDFLFNNLSPTPDQWKPLREILEHNSKAPLEQQKKLFDVMPKGTTWRYRIVFNNRKGKINLYFDSKTGDWTPDSPRTIDTEATAFELTPWMAQHLIWVVIQRVDTCIRLHSAGKYDEDNFDAEQVALDEEMLDFCDQRGLFGPMTLEEYREMIACGWINAGDVKNYRKCRGNKREVPLYDPQTGELVNPYRGKDGNWALTVDPSIVRLSGELISDDADFDDSYDDDDSDADAMPVLDNDKNENKRELEITYDSSDEDASPRLPAPSQNLLCAQGPFAARDSRSSPDSDGDPEPRSSPTPAPGYRQRKKARRSSPRPSPTRDNAPAAEFANPSRSRGLLQRRSTRATTPVSPWPSFPSLSSPDQLDLLNHPSSPGATVNSSPDALDTLTRRQPSTSNARVTAPVSPEPLSPSLLSSDSLDPLNHPPRPDTVTSSPDLLDTLTRHRPSTSNARAGPSTLATSITQTLRKFASKRYDYLVPSKAVQMPTRNRSGAASGSKQRTGKKKSAKTAASKKGKRKREEEDEDEEDET